MNFIRLVLLTTLLWAGSAIAEPYVTICFQDRVAQAELVRAERGPRGIRWVLVYEGGKVYVEDAVYDAIQSVINDERSIGRFVGFRRSSGGVVVASSSGVGINFRFIRSGGGPATVNDETSVGVAVVFPDLDRGVSGMGRPTVNHIAQFVLLDSVRIVRLASLVEIPKFEMPRDPANQRFLIDRGTHLSPIVLLPAQTPDSSVPSGFRAATTPWLWREPASLTERVNFLLWEDYQQVEAARKLLADGKPLPDELTDYVQVRTAERGLIRVATDEEWERARAVSERVIRVRARPQLEGFPVIGAYLMAKLPKEAVTSPAEVLNYLGPRGVFNPPFLESCWNFARTALGYIRIPRILRWSKE